jgi:hypothetical protein
VAWFRFGKVDEAKLASSVPGDIHANAVKANRDTGFVDLVKPRVECDPGITGKPSEEKKKKKNARHYEIWS